MANHVSAKPFKVMSIQEIEFYRRLSANPKSSFWLNFYDNMALKTVFKRLVPWLPTSFELSQALELDNSAEYSGDVNPYGRHHTSLQAAVVRQLASSNNTFSNSKHLLNYLPCVYILALKDEVLCAY